MLETVFYTSVLVSDQDRALDFYTNVLGLEKRVENPTPRARPSRRWDAPGVDHDRDRRLPKTADELKSRGVEFVSDVLEFPWGYVAQFQDPVGVAQRQRR